MLRRRHGAMRSWLLLHSCPVHHSPTSCLQAPALQAPLHAAHHAGGATAEMRCSGRCNLRHPMRCARWTGGQGSGCLWRMALAYSASIVKLQLHNVAPSRRQQQPSWVSGPRPQCTRSTPIAPTLPVSRTPRISSPAGLLQPRVAALRGGWWCRTCRKQGPCRVWLANSAQDRRRCVHAGAGEPHDRARTSCGGTAAAGPMLLFCHRAPLLPPSAPLLPTHPPLQRHACSHACTVVRCQAQRPRTAARAAAVEAPRAPPGKELASNGGGQRLVRFGFPKGSLQKSTEDLFDRAGGPWRGTRSVQRERRCLGGLLCPATSLPSICWSSHLACPHSRRLQGEDFRAWLFPLHRRPGAADGAVLQPGNQVGACRAGLAADGAPQRCAGQGGTRGCLACQTCTPLTSCPLSHPCPPIAACSRYVEDGVLDCGICRHDWVVENGADVVEVGHAAAWAGGGAHGSR